MTLILVSQNEFSFVVKKKNESQQSQSNTKGLQYT